MKIRYYIPVLFLFIFSSGFSQSNFGTWVEIEISKQLIEDVDLSFIPEVRFNNDFSVNEYILEGKINYEPFSFFEIGGAYRYNTEIKNKGNEISHSAVLDLTGKTAFDRFDASLRARFTNDSDGDDLRTFYFRPRAKLNYNINGSKLEPYFNYEIYINLRENDLYKQRFDIGVQRKIGDLHRVGIYYRLQDYLNDKTSLNILGIDYRFKF